MSVYDILGYVSTTINSPSGILDSANAGAQLAAVLAQNNSSVKSVPITWAAMGIAHQSFKSNVAEGKTTEAIGDAITIVGDMLLVAGAIAKDLAVPFPSIEKFAQGVDAVGKAVTVAGVLYTPLTVEISAEAKDQIKFLAGEYNSIPPQMQTPTGRALGSILYELGGLADDVGDSLLQTSNRIDNLKASLYNLYFSSGGQPSNNVSINIDHNTIIVSDNAGIDSSGFVDYDINGNIIGFSGATVDNGWASDYNIYPSSAANESNNASSIASLTHQLKEKGVSTVGSHKVNVIDSENNTSSTATAYDGNINNDVLQKIGGSSTNGITTATAGTNGETVISLISDAATTVVGGVVYGVTEILDTVASAATATADFVSKQVSDGLDWFTAPNSAVQLDMANWMAANLANLVNGNMSLEQAFVSLAKYVALHRVGQLLSDTIIDQGTATGALSNVFKNAGVTGISSNNIPLSQEYASSVYTALSRMAIDFAFNSSGWDSQQFVKSGLTTVASVIAFQYKDYLFKDTLGLNAGGAAAAATVLVAGLLNSSGFDSHDWLKLGVQAGVAYGSFVATEAILGAGAAGGPVGIITAAVISLVANKVIGALFGSAVYHEGEFGDIGVLLNSIYQVQNISDGHGGTTTALVAVNANGSTIISQGITTIVGNVGQDVLVGGAANDSIYGAGGSDYLEGRDGKDTLVGADGADHISGGNGDDFISGGAGDDIIFADAGNDTVVADDGDDFIHLGSGDDSLAAGAGNDIIIGGRGSDSIDGGADNDMIDGGTGDDIIGAGAGDDLVFGNTGNDQLVLEDGNDIGFGDGGNDQIYGGNGNDIIVGGAGIDILHGDNGDDFLSGGDDDDMLEGGLGNDKLSGGAGDDIILGGMDNDVLLGGAGDDTLKGEFGNDI